MLTVGLFLCFCSVVALLATGSLKEETKPGFERESPRD
jgi:hypothetical protein